MKVYQNHIQTTRHPFKGITGRMVMAQCKLCHKDRNLLKSHVYPDHLYRNVKNEDEQYVAIRPNGTTSIRQQGIWERSLCSECEQHLSREYENSFAEYWLNNNLIPEKMTSNKFSVSNIDYLAFKLYHISIIFRTSVSKLPSFRLVDLGPHEEIIRKMLLEKEDNSNYHLSAVVLTNKSDEIVDRLISFPFKFRVDLHNFYCTIYAGCAWLLKVSSHPMERLKDEGLLANGTMAMPVERWEKFELIQSISKKLKEAHAAKEAVKK